MSNMKDIMDKFKGKAEYQRKTWKTILKTDKNSLASNIIECIKTTLKTKKQDFEDKKTTPAHIDIRQSYMVTVVQNAERTWIYRQEEGLERLICALKNRHYKNGWGNQIIINKAKCSQKEYVDLVEYDRKTNNIISLIELKASNGNDSPLKAIIELLKNYFLCDFYNRQHIKNLILLAPKDYYIKHQIQKNKNFKTLIDELNKQLEVNIEIKEIDLKNDDWEIKVNKMLANLNLNFNEHKTSQYLKRTEVKNNVDNRLNIEDCVKKNLFSGVYECLKSQWKTVEM